MKRSVLFVLGIWLISLTCYSQNKESILSKVTLSVAQLKSDVIIGNGVCVASGIVVCPISTIGRYSSGQVMLSNGKLYNILGFTFADNDNDFVLLKIAYDSALPIKMANYIPVIGQKVFLTNKKANGDFEFADGRLNDLKDFGAVKLIQVGASSQFRSAGLPVIDSLGNMIGLSVMSPIEDSSSNFSIPVELIKKAMANEENLRKLEMLQPLFENLKHISFASKHKSKAVSDFLDMGILKLDRKDYKGAIEKFDMAIRISPVDADAFAFRGQAKSMLMQYKDALADFNKAIELQPDYAEVLDMRGVCKAELGDMKGACEDWKQSYEEGYNPAFKLMEKYCDLE
jgi:tetratricopeptide (TPR) repeat protein